MLFLIRADGVIDGCNLANKCKKGDLQAFPGGLKADTAKEGSIDALFVLITYFRGKGPGTFLESIP
jgi:hypothetical protein